MTQYGIPAIKLKRQPRIPEGDPRVDALLEHLPDDEYDLLLSNAQVLTLKHGQVLLNDGGPADMAYFPLTAIVSMIALMKNGDEIEYSTIGREGMVGL